MAGYARNLGFHGYQIIRPKRIRIEQPLKVEKRDK